MVLPHMSAWIFVSLLVPSVKDIQQLSHDPAFMRHGKVVRLKKILFLTVQTLLSPNSKPLA